MSNWKQPTPTDIRNNHDVDLLSRLIFFDILNGCQNKDYHLVYYHGNKRIDLTLKRGQYLMNISLYAKELKLPRRRIEKSLEIISKWYSELLVERKPYGFVITVLSYDKLTKMQNEVQLELKSNSIRSEKQKQECNKSVKNDIELEAEKYPSKITPVVVAKAHLVLLIHNMVFNKTQNSIKPLVNDILYWEETPLRTYPIAFIKLKNKGGWKDHEGKIFMPSLVTLLRTKDAKNNDVDYVDSEASQYSQFSIREEVDNILLKLQGNKYYEYYTKSLPDSENIQRETKLVSDTDKHERQETLV